MVLKTWLHSCNVRPIGDRDRSMQHCLFWSTSLAIHRLVLYRQDQDSFAARSRLCTCKLL